jgi:hypothetical protein
MSNQPVVLFSQNKPTSAISQTNSLHGLLIGFLGLRIFLHVDYFVAYRCGHGPNAASLVWMK